MPLVCGHNSGNTKVAIPGFSHEAVDLTGEIVKFLCFAMSKKP
jgi:hypothetical protein